MLNERQLVWRCRRGVRELDVLFTEFVAKHYDGISEAEQLSFQQLLDVQDPTIMDWLFDRVEPDAELKGIIETLKSVTLRRT
ncbi:succinate dehydrogenase assembly factor 2 [Arenicella xantha]|uniref:FAD assembly factor SdhE n=1 Tax=Arenicella xantha TaxID=644221 RepID=A0A395JH75_9GAMM|nr:succinate dehydrogenase assembly factor 2 [Arenicella xantha]RBP49266.1 antitoxin CptB [Arenicella xantha]